MADKQYGEPLVAKLLPILYLKRILDQDRWRIHGFWDHEALGERRFNHAGQAILQAHADYPISEELKKDEQAND